MVKVSKRLSESLRRTIYNRIEQNTTVTAEGSLSWTTFEFSEYLSILDDAFEFPKGTSSRVRHRATHNGVVAARKKGKLSDQAISKEISRALVEYNRKPESPYAMWTRIRLTFPIDQRGIKFHIGNTTLEISRVLPPYMRLTKEQFGHARPLRTKDLPRFGYLIVRSRGRLTGDVSEEMIDAAGLLISVFNLALRSWNIFGSEQKPEASILMGSYQYIFRGKRSLVEEVCWYNPDFRDDFWETSSRDQGIFKSAKSVRKALIALERHPLRIPLIHALRAANEAMETSDSTKRTLRYWTALERLFSTDGEKASYDRIIKRATFLEDDREIARAKLTRLLSVRNSYVHWGASEKGHHQLNQFVADLIRRFVFYIIFNGDDFLDHAELLEMADLPSDQRSLARRRKAIERREKLALTNRHR